MSTNATIGIENEDRTVSSIYCHWDGYPSHTGKILKEYYTDREKVKKLIALGDISYLEKEVEPTEEHSFDKPQKGVTIAYHRDRGEEYNPPQIDKDIDHVQCEEYGYVFNLNNEWVYLP